MNNGALSTESGPAGRSPSGDAITLTMLEQALRLSWGSDTCDELDADHWSPDHPSTGQCAATAYVVNDYFCGQLLGAEVHNPDGTLQGHHYWNLIGGTEIDLTREQFVSGEILQHPDVMERIHDYPIPGADRYVVLRDRVRRRLSGEVE